MAQNIVDQLTRFIHFIFFLSPIAVWCQQTNVAFPDLFARYDANMYLANAAFVPTDTKTDLSAYYKFQTGAFKDVATLVFSAAKLFERENKSIHSVRITTFNEKQGPYISSPRANANYGYELNLGEKTRLAGGVAGGVAGTSYSGIVSTGDATEFLPDASAGIILSFTKLQLGVSGLQLLNSKSKISTMVNKRYYHFHASHELDLNYNWKWKYYGLYRILSPLENQYWLGTSLIFNDVFCFGTVIRSNAGLSVYTELTLDTDKDRLKLIFNFNTFFKRALNFQNSMELGVGYVLK